ncbi:MAG: phage major capsid protein [Methermicoccaceae archaeon]
MGLTMEELEKKIADTVKAVAPEVVAQALEDKLKELDKPNLSKAIEDDKIGGKEGDVEKYEKIAKFYKAVIERDIATLKVLSGSSGATGGYLVPTELYREIVGLAYEKSIVLPRARRFPMKSNTLDIPARGTAPNVYWVDEGAQKTLDTALNFGKKTLSAKKLAAIVALTDELLADSIVDLVDYINAEVAEQFALEFDNQALNGTGSPITGILGDSGVNTVTMNTGDTSFDKIDATYLSKMIDALRSVALPGAAFMMHRTILGKVRVLKDSNGQYIWAAPAGNQPATIWGYPYLLSDKMPALSDSAADKAFVAFGNLKYFYVGDKGEMKVDMSQEASVTDGGTLKSAYEYDWTLLRFVWRVGGIVGVPAAFAILKTAAA